ncbi:MAG: efflux RND transporter periplasmic adaptor subunit [Nitrospirae bacterium]|nr:MAG: efflux RND transporter periplasmic adaptor subunit [Nitrospirota bacterium]
MSTAPKNRPHDSDLSVLSIPRPEEPVPPPRPAGRQRWWLWACGGGVLALGGYAALVAVPNATPVDVVTVTGLRSAEAPGTVSASGYVVAQRQAQVASKGTGRLEYLGVQVGDHVQTGHVIARIEQADVAANVRETQARLDVAKAALANARPELQDAALNHGRLQGLLAKTFVTQAEFDVAVARLRRARASVRSAEAAIMAATAELQAAEVQMESTNIRAPFDGTIVKKYAEVGEVVAPLAASSVSRGAVVLVADLTSLMVEAEVSESMIGTIRQGQTAELTLDAIPGKRYGGAVSQIVPTADRSKASILIKIQFLDLDERVLPEMSAKVVVQTGGPQELRPNAPLGVGLPKAALIVREGRHLVLAVKDGIVVERTVQVGQDLGSLVEVRGTLEPGDNVVINPPQHLKAGDAVRAIRKES